VPLPLRQFTAVAGRAAEFAALFNQTFAAGFSGPAPYRLDLTEPSGPSTGGGKQSLQHIRLVPIDGTAAIVIGSVSKVENSAEIRTFRHLADLHARRFKGARVPVDVNAYRQLTRSLHTFFTGQGFAVVMVDVSDNGGEPAPQPAAPPSQTPWIIAGAAIAVALGVVVIALMASRARPPEGPSPQPAPSAAAPAAS
jgi:hypothetical protein